MSGPRKAACNDTMLITVDSVGRANPNNFMTYPVAGSSGSGPFIAIVIELGFFTTNATSTLLAFSGMYLNHNRGISKHSNFINTSVLDI